MKQVKVSSQIKSSRSNLSTYMTLSKILKLMMILIGLRKSINNIILTLLIH